MNLVKPDFESEESVESFENGATEDEMLSEVSNKDTVKACIRQLLSKTCRLTKITVRNVFLSGLGTNDFINMSYAGSRGVKKKGTAKVQQKLLKLVQGSGEL